VAGTTLTIDAGPRTPAASNEAANGTNIEMLQMQFSASGGDVTVSQLIVRADGTGDDRTPPPAAGCIATNGIKIIEDVNGDGIYEPGIDQILGAGQYNSNDGQATISIALYISSSTTKYILVVMDLNGNANNGNTFRTRLNASGDVTSDATTKDMPTAPLYGSFKTVTTGAGSLAVRTGYQNPGSSSEANNASNLAMLQVALLPSSREDIIVSSITFTGSGTGHEATDISSARLFLDSNSDGVLQAGEPQIGTSQTFVADNGTVTFSGLGQTLTAGGIYRWLVVYNLNGSASNGETFIASLAANSDVSATGASTSLGITPTGTAPYTGGTKTISTTGSLTVSAGTYNPGARSEANNATNVEVMQLKLQVGNVEAVQVTSITFTASGTADDRSTAAGGDMGANGVRLYKDNNNNGRYDSSTDTQIGSSSNYSADNGTVTFSGLTQNISAGGTVNWLLVYNLGGSASLGETFTTQLASSAGISVTGATSGNPITATGTPVPGGTITISATGSLAIAAGPANPGDTNETNNVAELEMVQISVTASSVEDIRITSIVFNASGTGDDKSVGGGNVTATSVRLFRDANENGIYDTSDIEIGTGQSWSANNGTATFAGLGETVTAGTTQRWLLICTLNGTAATGSTFRASINANSNVTATGVSSGNAITPSGAPVNGGLKTISTQGVLTLELGSYNPGPTNEPNDAQNLTMLQIRLTSSSAEDMVATAITFTASGSAHEVNNITSAALYADTNSNGIYDSGTDYPIGGSTSFAADNGTVTFSGFNQTIPAASLRNWVLVYNLNGTAANGKTLLAGLSAVADIAVAGAVSGAGTVTGPPLNGSTKTISTAGTLTLSTGPSDRGSTNEAAGATNLVMLQANLAANAIENITITSLTVTAMGTADDRATPTGDVAASGVRLYVDVNSNGIYDAGTDTQLGSSSNYATDNGTLAFSGFSRTIVAGSSQNWLVVYDLAGSASIGETFQVKVDSNSDVSATGVTSGQTVTVLGSPVTGGTKTIAATGSLTITRGSNSPGDTNQPNNATGVPVLQLALTASSVENVTVNSVVLTASGTGDDRGGAGDLVDNTGLKMYLDANGDGLVDGGDTLLQSVDGFAADNGTATLTVARTVNAGATMYLLAVYDFRGSASNGETFICRVANNANVSATGATSSSAITPGGAPVQSYAVTISNIGTLALSAGPQNAAAPLGDTTEQNDATDVEMLQIRVAANAAEAINITSATFNIAGTGNDATNVTAASVRLYRDLGTAGTYDGSDVLLGSAQSWSADNGHVTFSGAPLRQIAAGSNESWLLVMSFNGTAVNAVTFQTRITGNASFSGTGVTSLQLVTVSGAPVTGGTKTIAATGTLAMAAGENNPAAGNEVSAAQDVEVVQIKLTTGPNEAVKITQFQVAAVAQSGNDATDIADVSVYKDVNTNGVFDSGTDTAIATGGTYLADNGTVTFSGLSQVIAASTVERWLVVYDFNGNATSGEQYQAQVATANITAQGNATTNAITATGSTVQGGIKTITSEGTLTCAIGAATPPASTEASDADGVGVLQVRLTADAVENITVSSIKFTDVGSNSGNLATELDAARLYNDTNSNGVLDGDPQIGGLGTISGTTITFSGLSEVVDLGTSENWLLVLDLSSGATLGETFQLRVAAAADINVSGSTPNPVSGSFPVSGNTITISNTPTLTVALGPENPAAGNAANDESNVEMIQLSMTASSSGNVTVTQIVFTASGTAHDVTDITGSSIELYRDNGTIGGVLDASDTLIKGNGTYSGDNGTVTFSGLSHTISAGTSQKWLLVYDLSGAASGGKTLAARVDAAGNTTISSGTVTGSFPVQGNTMTISATGTLTAMLGAATPPTGSINNNAQDVVMIQVRLTASAAENINISAITFTAAGTADDRNAASGGDLANSGVSLYRDANDNGLLDGDPLLGTGDYSADNGTITFSGLTEVINSSSTENWILVYDLRNPGTASNGETLITKLNATGSITAMGATSLLSITPSGSFPLTGSTMTISSVGQLTVAAGSANPANTTISNSDTNVEMVQLALNANPTENIRVTSIVFTASGTADDRNAAAGGDLADAGVRLYRDVNGNGIYDSATDVQIGSAGNYSADNGTVTFSGLTQTISAGSTVNWLLVYDLAGNAAFGETLIARLANNSDITATGLSSLQSITPSGAPVTGGTMTVSENAVLTASAGASNPGNTNEFNNATNLAMLQVRLAASNSGSDIDISSITFTASGTGDDRSATSGGDLTANSVRLYEDVGSTPGSYDAGDRLISGNGNFNADNGTVTFAGLTETISNNSNENWLVVIGLAGSASNGETFRVNLQAPATDIIATESGPAPGLTISGATVTGGLKTMTAITSVIWDGSDSAFWNVAANWDNNVVPGSSIDVTIPNVATDPIISANAQAKLLGIEANASLTVQGGNIFEVYGNLTLDGTLDLASSSTLRMANGTSVSGNVGSTFKATSAVIEASSGSYSMILNGNVEVNYVTISDLSASGVTLAANGTTTVFRNVVFYSGTAGVPYLHVTGLAWDGYEFVGLGFDGAGGQLSLEVDIAPAALITMTGYASGGTWASGDGSEVETDGTIIWGPTAAEGLEASVERTNKGNLVAWTTEIERNTAAYVVLRRPTGADEKAWEKLAEIPVSAPGGEPGERKYSHLDKNAPEGAEYMIRELEDNGRTGTSARAESRRAGQ
jgi:hypothetical protein